MSELQTRRTQCCILRGSCQTWRKVFVIPRETVSAVPTARLRVSESEKRPSAERPMWRPVDAPLDRWRTGVTGRGQERRRRAVRAVHHSTTSDRRGCGHRKASRPACSRTRGHPWDPKLEGHMRAPHATQPGERGKGVSRSQMCKLREVRGPSHAPGAGAAGRAHPRAAQSCRPAGHSQTWLVGRGSPRPQQRPGL